MSVSAPRLWIPGMPLPDVKDIDSNIELEYICRKRWLAGSWKSDFNNTLFTPDNRFFTQDDKELENLYRITLPFYRSIGFKPGKVYELWLDGQGKVYNPLEIIMWPLPPFGNVALVEGPAFDWLKARGVRPRPIQWA